MKLFSKIETKVLAAFLLAVLIVTALAISSWKLSRDQVDSALAESRTQELLGSISGVDAGLRQTESSTRAYVITGDSSFLNERDEGLSDLENALRRVNALISGKARQMDRWHKLRALVDARVIVSDNLVLVRGTENFEAARAVVLQGAGRDLSRRILTIAREMEGEELWLLAERNAEHARLRVSAVTMAIVSTLVLISLLTGSYFVIRRQVETTEASLRELNVAKTRFESILNTAVDGIITIDENGIAKTFNAAAERIFGYTALEVVEKNIKILMPEPFFGKHDEYLERYRTTGEARIINSGREVLGRRKNGETFPMRLDVSEMHLGGSMFYNGSVRDITEQKRMETQLRQKNDELEKQSRYAQEANRLKSEFLANMSHELRTPLNAIIGFSELIYDGKVGAVSPNHKEYLGDILTSSKHLLQLINDVLDLAKVESGTFEFKPEPVELEKVICEIRDVLRALILRKCVQLDVVVDPAIGGVFIDPSKLKQVLYNYLSNALKFTGDSGRITVRATPKGTEQFLIEVKDTGIGIKEADLHRLFTEFQQLDSSAAKKYQGTGLGLALTKRIVEAQGGHVGVTSVFGEGSVFYAVLPRMMHAGT